jgi:hypothetical protein
MQREPENIRFCERQIQRLQGTLFFGTLEDAFLKELRDTLIDVAADHDQAAAIVAFWLRGNAGYPTPADFCEIARAMDASVAAPPGCERCAIYGGFLPRESIRTKGVFAGQTYTGMVPCDCTLGQLKRDAVRRLETARSLKSKSVTTPGRAS